MHGAYNKWLTCAMCTCPTLRHGAFICVGPFLMIWVGLVGCQPQTSTSKFKFYIVGLQLVLLNVNIKFLSE